MPVEDEILKQPPINQQQEKEDVVQKPKRMAKMGSMVTPVVVAASILLAVASGFYITQIVNAPKGQQKKNSLAPKPKPVYIKLEEFTVNLKSGGQYLEAQIVFKADSDKVNAEIKKQLPEVRDRIRTILKAQDYASLLTDTGENILKEQIKNGVNKLLTEGKVISVHFTDFIMQ